MEYVVCTYDNGDTTDTTARPTHQHRTTCSCIWSIGFRVLYGTPFLKSNLTNIRIDFLSSICLPCVQYRKTCPHLPWAVKYLTTNGYRIDMKVIHDFDVRLSVARCPEWNRSFFCLSLPIEHYRLKIEESTTSCASGYLFRSHPWSRDSNCIISCIPISTLHPVRPSVSVRVDSSGYYASFVATTQQWMESSSNGTLFSFATYQFSYHCWVAGEGGRRIYYYSSPCYIRSVLGGQRTTATERARGVWVVDSVQFSSGDHYEALRLKWARPVFCRDEWNIV